MNVRQGDLISGIFALGIVVLIYSESLDMPEGPAAFPQLIAVGLLICSIILMRTPEQ